MKSRYAICVSYVIDVDERGPAEALSSAGFSAKYGATDPRCMSLSICHVNPIEQPKESIELPAVTVEPLPEIPEAAVSAANDIPF